MKRKKLLALLLTMAMLASLSIPAFAQSTVSGGSTVSGDATPAPVYSYSNTSDAFKIVNRSNVDTDVRVDVAINGMTDVTFTADTGFTKAGSTTVEDKALYLALLPETTQGVSTASGDSTTSGGSVSTTSGDAPIPVTTSGVATHATATTILNKAAAGAYKWKVKTDSTSNQQYYKYELRDDLENDNTSAEFSKYAIKMTGAVGPKGWETFATSSLSYTVTWTCAPIQSAMLEDATYDRVHYTWTFTPTAANSTEQTKDVYWDILAGKFYSTMSGDTVVDGLPPVDRATEVGPDGLPNTAYTTTKCGAYNFTVAKYVAPDADPDRVEYKWLHEDATAGWTTTSIFWDITAKNFYASAAKSDTTALTSPPPPDGAANPSQIGTDNKPSAGYLETNHVWLATADAFPRVAYMWTHSVNSADELEPIFWDYATQLFYTSETGSGAPTGLTQPTNPTTPTDANPNQIGDDGLPTEKYLKDNKILPKNVYANGTSVNNISFEGNAPDSIIDIDVPTDAEAANFFAFILDPNGLIEETKADIYGNAQFDFENSTGVFFKNLVTNGSGGNSQAANVAPTISCTTNTADGDKLPSTAAANNVITFKGNFGKGDLAATRVTITQGNSTTALSATSALTVVSGGTKSGNNVVIASADGDGNFEITVKLTTSSPATVANGLKFTFDDTAKTTKVIKK